VMLAQIFKVIYKLLDSSNKYMINSIGIGGGLVLNGKLYTGNSGLAAELGHNIIKQGIAECLGCGEQGCLEAYAGKVGI
ncbi:ROK family protein, partial [Francisella tularensis subsp. holarctica]|uniref:ROK family protein n=1 Tax=Francisella tularensis TaxID=263 RepID=UPI002381C92D